MTFLFKHLDERSQLISARRCAIQELNCFGKAIIIYLINFVKYQFRRYTMRRGTPSPGQNHGWNH